MPIYIWKCKSCGSKTEVFRSMSRCDVPPDYCTCKQSDWVSQVTAPAVKIEVEFQPCRHDMGEGLKTYTTRESLEADMKKHGFCYYNELGAGTVPEGDTKFDRDYHRPAPDYSRVTEGFGVEPEMLTEEA